MWAQGVAGEQQAVRAVPALAPRTAGHQPAQPALPTPPTFQPPWLQPHLEPRLQPRLRQ